VIPAYLPFSKRVDSNADVDRLIDGVDFDRRLRGPRDRDVTCAAEQRFDLQRRTANVDSVEQFAGRWDGDG